MPGSADGAAWSTEIRVVGVEQGHDFRGKAVHGKRAERFLYLSWGEVHAGRFTMFRRAKLMLNRIDPGLVTQAVDTGTPLHAKVDMTDAQGMPR